MPDARPFRRRGPTECAASSAQRRKRDRRGISAGEMAASPRARYARLSTMRDMRRVSSRPLSTACRYSAAVRGRDSASSNWPRRMVSGVRSSWEASAVNCRCAAAAPEIRASIRFSAAMRCPISVSDSACGLRGAVPKPLRRRAARLQRRCRSIGRRARPTSRPLPIPDSTRNRSEASTKPSISSVSKIIGRVPRRGDLQNIGRVGDGNRQAANLSIVLSPANTRRVRLAGSAARTAEISVRPASTGDTAAVFPVSVRASRRQSASEPTPGKTADTKGAAANNCGRVWRRQAGRPARRVRPVSYVPALPRRCPAKLGRFLAGARSAPGKSKARTQPAKSARSSPATRP